MKDYLIWIKSGACIECEANGDNLDELRESWKLHKMNGGPRFYRIVDKDGELTIDLGEVVAIGINEQKKEAVKVGY